MFIVCLGQRRPCVLSVAILGRKVLGDVALPESNRPRPLSVCRPDGPATTEMQDQAERIRDQAQVSLSLPTEMPKRRRGARETTIRPWEGSEAV